MSLLRLLARKKNASFRVSVFLALIATLLLALLTLRPGQASGFASLGLSAAPQVILADGKSVTVITANVRDSSGGVVADGTSVRFTTSLGTLDKDSVATVSGVARATLTSAPAAGTATVSATAFADTASGSSSGSTQVEFTTDRDAVFASGDSRWIRIDCPQYLIYSADTHIIEAEGRHGSAHLQFKSLEVTADSIQVDLGTSLLLARNAVLQRGRHSLLAAQLRYDLGNGTGTVVLMGTGKERTRSVAISGYGLEITPQEQATVSSDDTAPTNPYKFVDLSDSHVVVSARAIAANPGDQVQFRRASIYSDGRKLLSVPFHIMPMSTDQIFGQQVVGFGSQGLFLNVPFYYNVSPHSRGTLYLRNSGVAGASNLSTTISSGSSFFSTHGARPGFALDLEQTYDVGRGGVGSLQISGLTRSEWGAQWTHSQRIDEATNSYFFIDYPDHRSLYGSSNISRQFKGFSLNLTASGSRDPGILGYSSSSATLNTYVQTTPRLLGSSGVFFITDLTAQNGQLVQQSPTTGSRVIPLSTRGVDIRLFTAPLHPNRQTTFTDSVTVGQVWGGQNNQTAPTVLATLSLARVLHDHGSLSANYTYRYDPLLSQVGNLTPGGGPLDNLYRSNTQQRLTINYNAMPLPRLNLLLSGGYGLPLNDRNFFANMNYRVSRDWGLGLTSTQENYLGNRYSEIEYSLSRRILGRDLIFYYSTKTKKVRFDLGASSF